MAVQDGSQASGSVTATTSAAISVVFPIRATSVLITAATSGGCFVDVTGGVGVLATSSQGYPLAAGERLPVPINGGQPRAPGYYTGFSILGLAGVTSTVRYIALR